MQGFNMGRYRPPSSDPRTHPFNTTNPLSRRMRNGNLVVRFELPFPIVCLHCTTHLAQGVRFNAEKQQIGQYLSTQIWSFTCKCTCGAKFEIRTDPQNAQYVVGAGARRQVQQWDPEENGGHPIYDTDSKEDRGNEDAFATLEREQKDKSKAKERQKRIEELQAHQERWSDPYSVNAMVRSDFRKVKRARVEEMEKDLELKKRIGWAEDHVLVGRTPRSDQRDGAAWEEASSRRTARSKTTTTEKEKRTTAAERLRTTLVANTLKKQDPFLREMRSHTSAQVARPASSAARRGQLVYPTSASSSRSKDR